MYYAAVQIVDPHGYSSARSEPLAMVYMFPKSQSGEHTSTDEVIATATSHVYVAVAIGVIIAIALAASLVLLLIRHRRLQRSFASFATSHFNSRFVLFYVFVPKVSKF